MKSSIPYKTDEKRSYIMSRIRAKDTKPEIVLRKALFAEGFRYTLHNKNLPGSPDIVLRKYCTAILVNGCFWHGHAECKHYKPPKNNSEFWLKKIERNQERDRENIRRLTEMNWKVLEVWECELKKSNFNTTLGKVIDFIRNKTDEPVEACKLSEKKIRKKVNPK